jgi:hypothetical protein
MITLAQALRAWSSAGFAQTLKQELLALPSGSLPLHRLTGQGGMVDDSALEVTIISRHDRDQVIEARIGVFFTEIVINCGCGDEPMPVNAYGELLLTINKTTADGVFSVIRD